MNVDVQWNTKEADVKWNILYKRPMKDIEKFSISLPLSSTNRQLCGDSQINLHQPAMDKNINTTIIVRYKMPVTYEIWWTPTSVTFHNYKIYT